MKTFSDHWQAFQDAIQTAWGKGITMASLSLGVWPVQEWNEWAGLILALCSICWVVLQIATHIRDKWLRDKGEPQ